MFEEEPLPPDHPLWRMEHVMITPHNGGVTDRYHERATDIFLSNLDAYLRTGMPDANIVRMDRQY